ncbi:MULTISPECIES: HP1 family phage holin [Morganellaceae]|uniref:Bacteriophage protein n=3 Tax=Morganellaceae TaxID=1903414 RepID=A0AAI9MRS4_MORMO|nr:MULTISPECIES: HP1 family phage holin [Morganellaceae]EKW8760487.1 hypothetical protein [Morganella morganii]EIU9514645.1 hypothetical protein [Providencia rettgeri]EKH6495276.1 hypothetical protein [Providencia rettgeri]EKV9967314.1 hypothetical protein [Proteus mirabilis]ELA7948729.1 hypothetical protein [Proteus mirabilis]
MNPISFLEKDRCMDEKIAQFSTQSSYWFAGLGLFFSGLSLYEWAAIIGVAVSILLGIANLVISAYYKAKQTRLMEKYLANADKPDEVASKVISVSTKFPKEL